MSLNQASYDRICSLTVFDTQTTSDPPTLTQTDFTGTSFLSKIDGGPGYRIKFNIRKTQGPVPVPHAASMSIYNLGATNRAIASKLNNTVVLQAGYGKNAKTIFKGNIWLAITRKEGPDYITNIQAADGTFAFQNALIQNGGSSFKPSTPSTLVLKPITDSLAKVGITPGNIAPLTKTFNNGIVLSGKVIDALKTLCDANDMQWTIEDGKLNIVPFGAALNFPIVLVSPETGLIGIPELRQPTEDRAKALISFKMLLNPDLSIFQLVRIKSKFINGNYAILTQTHSGDTFENEWYTECEASG